MIKTEEILESGGPMLSLAGRIKHMAARNHRSAENVVRKRRTDVPAAGEEIGEEIAVELGSQQPRRTTGGDGVPRSGELRT
ncbi:hypothetical protein [Mycobacterium decipiens]|uniref:hypothetical protein n=1 Tax=Mycobacterium decipiens TaxID=1430326 RepID=UPI00105514C4|nr:hypothetical protein [Mycobacterium decipiens]